MPLKVSGIIDTEQMLINIDTTAKKRVRAALIRRALSIRDRARKYAPRDVGAAGGDLEKAIKVRGDGARERDDLGRFTRVEVEVYIDMDQAIPLRPGKVVGDYAYIMHEHLTPYGLLQLGPQSRAKQAGQREQVGGGFLERAAADEDSAIEAELLDILRDL